MDPHHDTSHGHSHADDASSTRFCHGEGMIMYMDGLRFSLWSSSPPPCLNLLSSHMTLNTRWKFVGAMVGVLLLSVAVEGISKLRHVVSTRRRHTSGSPTSRRSHSPWWWQLGRLSWYRRAVLQSCIPLLHGLQALAGYTLMLITMTYSMELLLSVVVGLTLGYYIFFVHAVLGSNGTDMASRDETVQLLQHVATNPCCDYMQEPVLSNNSNSMHNGRHEDTLNQSQGRNHESPHGRAARTSSV